MSTLMSQEQLARVLPKSLRQNATPELMNKINNLAIDPMAREAYRDNLLNYTTVMREGRFHMAGYVDAVHYVTNKLLGDTNIRAYVKTFPDKYQNFLNDGVTEKTISSYVNAYNKTKLVNLILEQTLVPSHILNADLYQKALNIQAELMTNEDVSPKVRSDAANSLLVHLKMPETTKIELDINVKEDSVINELRESTLALAKQQRAMIEAGALNPKEVAESKILIEGECEDVS